ncbi:MAG: histidine phosphatase family protein [Pirellulales bacterium]|nr:histidine phosphatase family protein [Pirellulales bacterium]
MTIDETALAGKKLLVLMRHAKSDWGDSSLSDHDRPLNPRGRSAAPRMADWMAGLNVIPEKILCSSSVRTCQTTDLMVSQWNHDPEIQFCDTLYLAAPESILNTIATEGDDAQVLMVVAHNPGMSALASHLAEQSIEMPTAAVAIFEVSIDQWSHLQSSSTTQLVHHMRPKAL